ncbi:MAG: choice-of-anchor Q domain-containing protein [Rubripirellula sp.]
MPNSAPNSSRRRRRRLRMENLESRRLLATLIVNSTDDGTDLDPGDGVCEIAAGGACTLRAAIQEANALANSGEPDRINIPVGTYTLTLTGQGEQQSITGDLDITSDVILQGAGASETIIDAAGIDRAIDVVRGNVVINGITVRGGFIEDEDDPVEGAGGGIRNEDTLTVADSVITGNVSNIGAGVANYNGSLRVERSSISGNGAPTTTTRGGGIANYSNYDPAVLEIIDSTISGNQATAGGGINNRSFDGSASTTISQSTISGNTAQTGAGISNRSVYYYSESSAANLTLTGSTVSGNIASAAGGGVHEAAEGNSRASATFNNSTIAFNTASSGNGGGIAIEDSTGTTATLRSSIVAGNSAGGEGPDLSGADIAATFSLIQTEGGHAVANAANNNLVGQDPLLGSLADNGGLTQTHVLMTDSPAIDQGSNPIALTADQRGSAFLRTIDDAEVINAGDGTDMGAVEVGQVAATSDFGDAPESINVAGILRQYPTTLAADGARHLVTSDGPRLGNLMPDAEPDGTTNAAASGDDQASVNDEDGLTSVLLTPGESLGSLVIAHDGGSDGAILSVWVDLNIDGDWDDVGEQVLANLTVPAGPSTTTLTGTLPANAMSGTTFLRARISTTGNLTPRGEASDGEVEDHPLTIGMPPPQVADLSIAQSVNNANPTLGEEVTFTITVSNDGPDRATNVEVTDFLVDSLIFERSTVSQGTYDDLDGIWSVGSLNSGAIAILTITATVDTSDTVSNTAEILASDQDDPDSTPDNGIAGEDDQSVIDLGTCLSGGPLQVGMNRLTFTCASPGSFSAFVIGSNRGNLTFENYDTTVDLSDATVVAIAIADINGVAVAEFEATAADLNQTVIAQAFEIQPGSQKSNTFALDATAQMLRATVVTNPEQESALTNATLAALLPIAVSHWQAAGVSAEDLATMRSTAVEIRDLPGDAIGRHDDGRILVDINAAGNGWFDDPNLDPSQSGNIDLLTTLIHEYGHSIGLPDLQDASNVMHVNLDPSVRRLPTTNTNPNNPLDANNDLAVSALDALVILNRIKQNETTQNSIWIGPADASLLHLDTNADYRLTALDALAVINQLAKTSAEGEQLRLDPTVVDQAEPIDGTSTPPSQERSPVASFHVGGNARDRNVVDSHEIDFDREVESSLDAIAADIAASRLDARLPISG